MSGGRATPSSPPDHPRQAPETPTLALDRDVHPDPRPSVAARRPPAAAPPGPGPAAPRTGSPRQRAQAQAQAWQQATSTTGVPAEAGEGQRTVLIAPATPPSAPAAPPAPKPEAGASAQRTSFLRQVQIEPPATQGWRGRLAALGLPISPSAAERAERGDIAAVCRQWAGHRTVAVVNGKGGSSKSPTAALLSAVFARHGGTGVVAWENNQTRGTLGWRTEQGPHEATLLDLLPAVPELLSRHACVADLARFTHHQVADRYAVLRAQPMALAEEQRISPDDVSAIHEVVAKFNRLIIMDSGNDESDPMWRRMIDHSDQIVVATTTRDDHAEVAALLLEALARGDHHRALLAERAVVVVSQADRNATSADLDRVAAGFEPLAREVVTIPFDPGMVDGILRWASLRARTQRCWLRAGAAVSRAL